MAFILRPFPGAGQAFVHGLCQIGINRQEEARRFCKQAGLRRWTMTAQKRAQEPEGTRTTIFKSRAK
jgi:hypothetical protein